MSSGLEIVDRALEQLKSSVNIEDAHGFANTSLHDVYQEARDIEKQQADKLDLRFMRRIEPYLASLESYAGVIEVFCQGYPPMSFVWGPIKLMLQLARRYTNVMESILQAFSEIAAVLPRVDRLRATFPDDADLNRAVGLIYSDISEFHQRAYKVFRRKGWHIWFTVSWGLFERQYKSIMDRLSLHSDLLDREAASIHFSEMKVFRDKRKLEVDALEKHDRIQMATNVRQWLESSSEAQEEHLHRLSDDRLLGTCDWILDDIEVQSWMADDVGNPILWMTGIPGAGKSFLSSLIVQNLQSQQDRSTIYYFCGKPSSGNDSTSSILRTLAMQSLRQNHELMALVHQDFVLPMASRSAPNLKKLLSQILTSAKPTRIVIDGIDECSLMVQQETIKAIVEMRKQGVDSCKVLICSRQMPEIEKLLPSKKHMRLGQKTENGLGCYIKEKVKEVQEQFEDMSPELVNRVEAGLKAKAKGMFLWVRLVVIMLNQQISEDGVERAIDDLPDGLNEAYGQILERIKSLGPVHRDRAFRILAWVCTAYRPVSVNEVADGIVLNVTQKDLNRKTRSRNTKRDIVDLCAPILETSADGILDLVHFSAKEYLIHEQSGPFIDKVQAHLNIAVSCIINLTTCLKLVPGFSDHCTEVEAETGIVQGHFGLHSYGHDFWVEHTVAAIAGNGDSEPQTTQLLSTLRDFSRAYKHHTARNDLSLSKLIKGDSLVALYKLERHPILFCLIISWLNFKSRLKDAISDFDGLSSLQEWKLKSDETHLSRIELEVHELTQRLLALDQTDLPHHIDKGDYELFKSRFPYRCRLATCGQVYGSTRDRDAHEAMHAPSFPCLQCDFAVRGFKTRKDLERHVQRYHASPNDFAIPDTLQRANDDDGSDRTRALSFKKFGRWNEQGREVLKEVFNQTLSKVENEVKIIDRSTNSKGQNDDREAAKGEYKDQTSIDLSRMREKIEDQTYECLTQFQDDLHNIVKGEDSSARSSDELRVQAMCDEELENAASNYPAFASFDHTILNGLGGRSAAYQDDLNIENTMDSTNLNDDFANLDIDCSAGRLPYWSKPEERQFPELVQTYGRDYLKIAEVLKTKTIDEISEHLENLIKEGNTQLTAIADRADERTKSEIQSAQLNTDAHGATETTESNSHTYPNPGMQNHPPRAPQPGEPDISDPLGTDVIHPSMVAPLPQAQPWAGPRTQHDEQNRPRTKRKPKTKVPCDDCAANQRPHEFSDSYARDKHIARFHAQTRKVWLCNDISPEKNQFKKCKSCRDRRQYSTRHYASKHLRKRHFDDEMPLEELHRWIEEKEEPNPNARRSTMNPALLEEPALKRQKIENMQNLAQAQADFNDQNGYDGVPPWPPVEDSFDNNYWPSDLLQYGETNEDFTLPPILSHADFGNGPWSS